MTTIKGFVNYGVTTHEYQNIFTISNPHAYATYSKPMEITLPDGWTASKTLMGTVLIDTPDGTTYTAGEIIQSRNDKPVLHWFDGQYHTIALDYTIL